MKAVFTPAYGSADILETREVERPDIGEHDVLVRIHAAAVTAGDRRLRSADFPGMTAIPGRLAMGVFGPRNALQGTMFSGQVVEIGSAVTRYAVGDDVFGSADHGAYAEYIARSEESAMAKIPANISYEEAAAVPYGAGTALHFLRDHSGLQPGQKILIVGASGGVGRYAIQIAKHMGAEVTGVSSKHNLAGMRALGADHVLDYTTTDFTRIGKKYDVIFDIADSTSFGESERALTKTGRFLTLYMSLGVLFQMAWTALRGGKKAKFSLAMSTREDLEQLQSWMEQGVIRPVIAECFPFDRIQEAHAAADAGRLQGDVLVRVAPTPELRAVG